MSITPQSDLEVPPLSGPRHYSTGVAVLIKAKEMSEAERQSSSTPAATTSPTMNFESQVRSMIVSNGVSSQSSLSKEQTEPKSTPSLDNLPPHLRAAPPSDQKEYHSKHDSSKSTVYPKKPYKKPNQAQRRKLPLNHDITHQVLSSKLPDANGSAAIVPDIPPISSQKTSRNPANVPNQPVRTMQSHPSSTKSSRSDVPQPRHPPQIPRSNSQRPNREHFTQLPPVGAYQPRQTRSTMTMPLPYQHTPRSNPQPFKEVKYNLPPETFAARPHPSQNRQLFNPRLNSQEDNHFHHAQTSRFHHRFAPVQMQVNYLNDLAYVEVPRAEISSEDLKAKEQLRVMLEKICRSAIGAFERTKDQAFDSSTVGLKCFGSLSSGFATYSSDMDLALVSPVSKPDAASADCPIPRLLEKALLDLGYGARLLTKTRVPIIKFCEKPTPQLAEALLKERSKWERLESAPPKPKRVKKTKAVEKDVNTKKPSKSKRPKKAKKAKNSQEPEAPEVRRAKEVGDPPELKGAESIFENDRGSKITESGTKSHPEEISTVTTLNGDSSCTSKSTLPKVRDGDKDNTDENPSEEAEDSESSGEQKQLETNGRGGVSSTEDLRDKPTSDNVEIDASETFEGKDAVRNADGEEGSANVEISGDKPIIRSDEELTRLYQLAIREGWFTNQERTIIFRFMKAVEESRGRQTFPELVDARAALQSLPDVLKRYRDIHNELDFPKTGVGIQCDINFSNLLALHNTHLLRCYSHCDPRIRPMVLFVKAWAKRRKINSPYTGTLSSYGYVLMVLHFAVNVAEPPLAPNLQLSGRAPPAYVNSSETEVNGYNVRFWRSEKEIRDCAALGKLSENREPIGSLLRNFFHYFAVQGPNVLRCGFSWTTDVLSLRTYDGLLSKKDKGWTGAKTTTIEPTTPGQESKEVKHRYLFAIEDPFEIDHNIARTVIHNGIVAIREEFRRANRIIQHAGIEGGVPVYLFEEAKGMVSPRTFFGPHPRPVFGPENLAEELRPVVADLPGSSSPPPSPPKAKTRGELVGYLSPASDGVSDDVCEKVDVLTLDDGIESVNVGSKSESTERLT